MFTFAVRDNWGKIGGSHEVSNPEHQSEIQYYMNRLYSHSHLSIFNHHLCFASLDCLRVLYPFFTIFTFTLKKISRDLDLKTSFTLTVTRRVKLWSLICWPVVSHSCHMFFQRLATNLLDLIVPCSGSVENEFSSIRPGWRYVIM